MTTYIGITIGALFVSVLHLGMQPSEAKQTPYQLQLNVMLKDCVERGNEPKQCQAIERVINRSKGVPR